jgi:hypothetical protein
MKTLKANNLSQAAKELKAIDEALVEKLNENIKEADKKHYHVILIKITERPGQVKNNVSFIIQKYTPRSFDKVKKQVAFLGFAAAIVLHDPSLLKEEDKTIVSTFEKTKTVEQVTKELEAKHKKEKEDLIKQLNDAKSGNVKTEGGDGNGSDDDTKVLKGDPNFDVAKAVKDDLIAFAGENEIDLKDAKLVDDIRKVVSDWLEAFNTSK